VVVLAECWGSEISDGIPEHKNQEQVHESYDQEIKNLESLYSPQKL
jgi:hypothetical protein